MTRFSTATMKAVAKLAAGICASIAGSMLAEAGTMEVGQCIAGAISARKAEKVAEAAAETTEAIK